MNGDEQMSDEMRWIRKCVLALGIATCLTPAVASAAINPLAVNNPAADTTARDTQSVTTVQALGNHVAVAFEDSGSCLDPCSLLSGDFTGWSSSTDFGASFADHGAPVSGGEGDGGEPVLAALDGTDTVYLATRGSEHGRDIQVAKSTDGGASFGAPVNATPGAPLGGFSQDKEWIDVDGFPGPGAGTVYVCRTNLLGPGGPEIRLTRSTDGGATFGPSGGTLISTGGQGCYVAVGPDHGVYVLYFRGTGPGGGDNRLWVRRSTDQGLSFGPEHQLADLQTTSANGDLALNQGPRSNSFPQAAINPSNGDLIAVYNDDTVPGPADNGDVFYVKSTDDGNTWSPPVQVNEDGPGDQFSPTVAISPQGNRAMFGYYSRSHDPANRMFHRRGRMAVISPTTGNVAMRRSFQLGPDTPVAVAEATPVDPDVTGGYDQMAANDSTFFSTWSDNRDGNSFRPLGQPDVFIARIDRNAPVTATDLSVGVTPVPATIHEGEQTTLELSATATGHQADDVYVSLAPTNGLAYQAVGGGSGCKLTGGLVSCSLGSIPAGTTVQRDVTALGVTRGKRVARAKATTSDKDTDQANNGGAGTVTVKAPPSVTETFSTGDIAVTAPQSQFGSTGVAPLPIATDKTILDIDAFVRLNGRDRNLEIYLTPPGGGPPILLSSENGGSGISYGTGSNDCSGTPTRFDDSASTSIIDGLPPFAGSFRPQSPLANLNGASTSGTWLLGVTNWDMYVPITVGCFKLRIKHSL